MITVSELILLDVRSMKAVEATPLQTQLLTSQDFFSGLSVKNIMENVPESFTGSVRTYRGKLFLLVREIETRNDHGLISSDKNQLASGHSSSLERPYPFTSSPW